MKNFESLGLRVESGRLYILDQELLPREEVWLESRTPDDMIHFIRALKVRGAPLIGVAAALALARFVESGATPSEVLEAGRKLKAARPTAVNLMAAVERVLRGVSAPDGDLSGERVIERAEDICAEDVALCAAMGRNGASQFADRDSVLTHCNTGGLATVGIGTALGVIRAAFESGKRLHVYVDETRPLLQGGRLTTWELRKLGIPFTLICDNMAAMLMKQGKIAKAIVGSDRIARNGDFANKIGTYGVAVAAAHHGVPFYIAAPYTTIDWECPTGEQIPIEERNPREVRADFGDFAVYNPAFDVTPAALVTGGYVLDRGFYKSWTHEIRG